MLYCMIYSLGTVMDTVICVYCKYRLRSAWLIVLIRLAIPPCCILLISASSSADCVTLASVTC